MSQEPGYERRCGVQPYVLRRAVLHCPPLLQHEDVVRHRERLVVVVGHIDQRHALVVADATNLPPKFRSQVAIERAERLIEHEETGARGERAGKRHPLLFAARKRVNGTVGKRVYAHQAEEFINARPGVRGGPAEAAQAEGDIVAHVEVREQGEVLVHESEAAAVGGVSVSDAPSTDTSPPSANSSPAISRNSVLFPHPLGPKTARDRPDSSANETSASAKDRPPSKLFESPLTSSNHCSESLRE